MSGEIKIRTFRASCSGGGFIEGIKGSGEHVHYENCGGSDIPASWKNEITGEKINLKQTTLIELRSLGLIK